MQEADLGPLFRASSNASLGDFLRDEGIARALEAAGDDWKQQAIQAILHEFAGRIVMFEECSSFCMGLGIAPPGSNAWGALCRSMALSGLLELRLGKVTIDQVLLRTTVTSTGGGGSRTCKITIYR